MQLREGVKGAHSCLEQESVVSGAGASVGAPFIPGAALGQPPPLPTTRYGEMMLRWALRAALAWRCAVSVWGAGPLVVMVLVKFLAACAV